MTVPSPRPARRHPIRRCVLTATLGLLALGVVGQLVVPRIAERVVTRELQRYGDVRSVSVSSFPFWELASERIDAVEIVMGETRDRARSRAAGPTPRVATIDLPQPRTLRRHGHQVTRLLRRARGVERLDARVSRFATGKIAVENLTITKRGNRVTARGSLRLPDVQSALPAGLGLTAAVDGDGLYAGGSYRIASGVTTTVRARLRVHRSSLVLEAGVPGGTFRVPVFADPGIDVLSVQEWPCGERICVTLDARVAW